MITHIGRFQDGATDLKDMFLIASDVQDMKDHFDKLLVIMFLHTVCLHLELVKSDI